MNEMNSLHNVKEHYKISNFLQLRVIAVRVRTISDLRDLYGNKIQGLSSFNSNFFN